MNPIGPHVILARSTTLRKIQTMIRQNYGANYRVELFGSTSYGVDSPTSDLDLVIMVRKRFHPQSPSSSNFHQDTARMDGFPPSLDLNRLPRECIVHSIDHSRPRDSCHSQAIYNVRSVTAGVPHTSISED